jgi:hypothetical protein
MQTLSIDKERETFQIHKKTLEGVVNVLTFRSKKLFDYHSLL